MKEKNSINFNIQKSSNLTKSSSYLNKSTPKKNNYSTNKFNFNNLTKLPPSYINVFCRFRPTNELELLYSKNDPIQIQSSKRLLLKEENKSKIPLEFIFDEIFEPNNLKSTFYNKTCKNIVKGIIYGFNGGIIFYGESGSGKTYTLKEIIPKITKQIYEEIYNSNQENEFFKIDTACFEVYKEEINDLLKLDNINLNLIESKDKKINIQNLTFITINNEEELNNEITKGLNNRNRNNRNNNIKSHFIIEIKVYRYYKNKNIIKYGTLYIAELEGIEGNSDKKKISEKQKFINKSIDDLKLVVKKLNEIDEQDNEEIHIPYKNSKLTRILSDCFGGNCYTSFILTCSKSEYHIDQTKNIFYFGQNVKKIKNNPNMNVELNANKSPILKEIIIENNNKKKSSKLKSVKQLNNRYQNRIIKNKSENKELYKKNFITEFNNPYSFNLLDKFNNLSKKKGESSNKSLLLSKNFSDKTSYSQNITKNNVILKNFSNSVINDLLSNKNYYLELIQKNKNQIDVLKFIVKEKENQTQNLNNELNEKNNQIILLEEEKKKIENNLDIQIKNDEGIIKELREAKDQSDSLITKYKNNIDNLNIKINELELKNKNLNEDKEKKNNDFETEINNYKNKLSELKNDISLKDSTIKKMNGEMQILKSELSNLKTNNDDYSNKIKDLENELNTTKIKQNNESDLLKEKLLKINDLEKQLKENKNIIDEYKNKYNLIDKELKDTKILISNLNKDKENLLKQNEEYKKNNININLKEKEILLLKDNNKKFEKKNKDQERELALLKKMIQNLQKENETMREKTNNYEEIKMELDCLKNRGNNYSYIEINKSSLQQKYDKLFEENNQLKEIIGKNKESV